MNLWRITPGKDCYEVSRSDKDYRVTCNDLAMAYDIVDLLNCSAVYGIPSSQTQSSTRDSEPVSRPASLMDR